MRLIKRVLKIVGLSLAVIVMLAVAVFWWIEPKRPVSAFYVARGGREVFKLSDVPRGHALSRAEVDALARRLLGEMTLEQKTLEMGGDTWIWQVVPALWGGRWAVGVGWLAGADRRLAIPPLVFSDGSHGIVMNDSTSFPVAVARAASWDRDLERRVGAALGAELRAQGGDVWLGPCVNLLRHPAWGRSQETYGEDPFLAGELAAAVIDGVQRGGVMACVKHFALNSIEETRTHVDVRVDERTLREVYLPQFKRAVDADVASVMSAYNRVNGDYCGENRHLLREILKEEWGFAGFVVSDWWDGVYDGVKAAHAGLDLEMPTALAYGHKLQAAVENGRVPREQVDEAVLRLLRRRIEYRARSDVRDDTRALVHSAEHVALAREAAEKGLVLLQNDGPLLPLDAARVKRLTVVGRLAEAEILGDHGSSRVWPPHAASVVEGLRDYLCDRAQVMYESGADLGRARAAAQGADAVLVVVGLDHADEGEYISFRSDPRERGGDRKDLALHATDRALIEAVAAQNPRTIVVLVGGAAITCEEWRARVPSIVMAFYPGEQGGAALARVLFGEVNPSGKLPFTWPKDPSQLPPFDNRSDRVEYGYYHGYALAEKRGFEPAFPFGWGLSYTTVEYAHLKLQSARVRADGELRVSVDVTNVGRRTGAEVVQLYVGFPGKSVDRPVKLLRGFEKIALAPSETKTVSFVVKAADLAYYDPDTRRWIVERGAHAAYVGSSSRAADLMSAPFDVVD